MSEPLLYPDSNYVNGLRDEVARAKADMNAAFERANEAARLSAAARDEADDLRAVIEKLREHIAIVEDDRTANDIWAFNVIAEFGIEHEPGDLLGAIARYVRACKDDLATYRHVVDSSIETREQAIAEMERQVNSVRMLETVVQQAEDYVEERDQRNADLASDLLETRAQLHKARIERDNAVERLNLAMSALVATGYFTAYQVSEDVAPRIWELHSALTGARDEALEQARTMAGAAERFQPKLVELEAEVSHLNVALEAAEFDRDEARQARDEYAAEVERLRRELTELRGQIACDQPGEHTCQHDGMPS